MSRMSVPDAASELGVSVARIRQRIEEGSLVAERVGGRWLVDLASAGFAGRPQRGRPVHPGSVWYSLLAVQRAGQLGPSGIDVLSPGLVDEAMTISPASRHRAAARLAEAIAGADHDAILSWLRHRGQRRVYMAAIADLPSIREDERLLASGLSHPDSGMSDPRVAEGYVAAAEANAFAADHWLDLPSVDDSPNVFLHVVPALPSHIASLLLAADLAEHGGPRERRRAYELLSDVIGAKAGRR